MKRLYLFIILLAALALSNPAGFKDLVVVKKGQPSFVLRTLPFKEPTAVVYEEMGSRTTKAPVNVVVEGRTYLLDSDEFRLYIASESDGIKYRLDDKREYFGRIAEESISLPPKVKKRHRFVLIISDQPFDPDGQPVVKSTPRTKSMR